MGTAYVIQAYGTPRLQSAPMAVTGPGDLGTLAQLVQHLRTLYSGSTKLSVEERAGQHAISLLRGEHPSLQELEQPVIDMFCRLYGDAGRALYTADLQSRTVPTATVSAASVGGDLSQLEVLLGAAEQMCINTNRAANASGTAGPRYATMPGLSQATGACCSLPLHSAAPSHDASRRVGNI